MQTISVVSVPVSDQDRSKHFYVETLGFEVVDDASWGDGERWIQVRPHGSQTSLTLVTWFDEMQPGTLRGLVVDTDDIHRDYQILVERNADVSGPPAEQVGGTFCFVHDPDGNVISLHQVEENFRR